MTDLEEPQRGWPGSVTWMDKYQEAYVTLVLCAVPLTGMFGLAGLVFCIGAMFGFWIRGGPAYEGTMEAIGMANIEQRVTKCLHCPFYSSEDECPLPASLVIIGR